MPIVPSHLLCETFHTYKCFYVTTYLCSRKEKKNSCKDSKIVYPLTKSPTYITGVVMCSLHILKAIIEVPITLVFETELWQTRH